MMVFPLLGLNLLAQPPAPPAVVAVQQEAPSVLGRDANLCSRPDDPCRLGAPIAFDRPLSDLPDMSKTPIKIGVAVGQSEITFGGKGQLVYRHGGQMSPVRRLENETLAVSRDGDQVVLKDGAKEIGRFDGWLIFRPDEGTHAGVNGKWYRGKLELVPDPQEAGKMNAVNLVLMEDYLKGVLPAEVIATWDMEALKAQAIAARTYSIANLGRRAKRGFDMYANTDDQMYAGLSAEQNSTSQAVEATRGQVMSYQGKAINALFFAASGGMTDSAEAVWGIDLPYIQPRPDFDQAAPKYRWTKQISQADLQKMLQKFDLPIGEVTRIEVMAHTPGGRAATVRLVGDTGEATLDSKLLRFSLGLFSTRFQASAAADGFVFEGGGWGHGLGMSQWGARQMALDGKVAPEILRHYYQGIQIEALPGTLAARTP